MGRKILWVCVLFCTFVLVVVLFAATYRIFITTVKITLVLAIPTTEAGTCALSNLTNYDRLVLFILSGKNDTDHHQRHIAVVRNNLFGNNSGKPEPIGTKFYTQTWLRWHALLQTLGALRLKSATWRRKTYFLNVLSQKQRIASPTFPWPISVKLEHKK